MIVSQNVIATSLVLSNQVCVQVDIIVQVTVRFQHHVLR